MEGGMKYFIVVIAIFLANNAFSANMTQINDRIERERIVLISYKYGLTVEITKAVLSEYRQRHDIIRSLEVKPKRSIKQLDEGHEETISAISLKYKIPLKILASIIIDFKMMEEK
jgi:hypothetical protein